MRVLAVDQASTSGYCLAGDKVPFGQWRCGHFRAPKRDEEGQRLIIIHDSIVGLIKEWKPDLLVLEKPFNPTYSDVKEGSERPQFNQAVMEFLQRVKGAVIMAAARCDVPTEEYPVQSWRATLKMPKPPPNIIGWAARSKWIKQQVQITLRRYGVNSDTLDEADAAGLAWHACFGGPGIARATGDLFNRARASL